jgi:hypothetical protein
MREGLVVGGGGVNGQGDWGELAPGSWGREVGIVEERDEGGEGELSEGREEPGEGVSCGEALVHAPGASHKAWGECARKG